MARHSDRATLLNVNGGIVRHIDIREANKMVALGEAICLASGKQAFFRLLEPRTLTSQIRNNSISFAETEANVGLRGCRRRARRGYVGNFVDRAMTKIEIWPEVGDTRAIRVGPKSSPRKPPQSVRPRNASRSAS